MVFYHLIPSWIISNFHVLHGSGFNNRTENFIRYRLSYISYPYTTTNLYQIASTTMIITCQKARVSIHKKQLLVILSNQDCVATYHIHYYIIGDSHCMCVLLLYYFHKLTIERLHFWMNRCIKVSRSTYLTLWLNSEHPHGQRTFVKIKRLQTSAIELSFEV